VEEGQALLIKSEIKKKALVLAQGFRKEIKAVRPNIMRD